MAEGIGDISGDPMGPGGPASGESTSTQQGANHVDLNIQPLNEEGASDKPDFSKIQPLGEFRRYDEYPVKPINKHGWLGTPAPLPETGKTGEELKDTDKMTVQKLRDLFTIPPKIEPNMTVGFGEGEVKPLTSPQVKNAVREWFMDNQPRLEPTDAPIDWKDISDRLSAEIAARQIISGLIPDLSIRDDIQALYDRDLLNDQTQWLNGPDGEGKTSESSSPDSSNSFPRGSRKPLGEPRFLTSDDKYR